MVNLLKGVAATLRRTPGRAATQAGAAQPNAAVLARRRQVAALRRRRLSYAPELDGQADPGEIVWTWVPYEEDPHQGKDRPVLVVGRESRTLFGLMLSSQSERDGQPHWLALGPGEWDQGHRPSWIRLNRVLTMREDSIRREGAVLDLARFDRVAQVLRARYGWA
ncbi:type II toxin-antitoxin system PemK/MazF family toxin [Rugosimonospora acidiphila]|uniref:type II toxin-antitoxin system PemK/MazF family toxin n=1 Tax=Rugosimonospora acidiphila TaxID=556531 RepID=UPI003CD0AF06